MDLLLDVERWSVDDEIAPILLVLAPPDELWIEVAVASVVLNAHRPLMLRLHDRLHLCRWDVAALVAFVRERLDRLPRCGLLLRHRAFASYGAVCALTESMISPTACATRALKSLSI